VIYLWLKAFHIAAVLTWIAGLLITAFVLSVPVPGSRLLIAAQRWDRTVTSPAMLLVWTLGLTIASRGGWFGYRWLWTKIAIVVFLSGLHGIQAGTLRRMIANPEAVLPPAPLRYSGICTLAAALIIAVLVVTKPF
jgi:uncharacterized membrane protein